MTITILYSWRRAGEAGEGNEKGGEGRRREEKGGEGRRRENERRRKGKDGRGTATTLLL
jgi:hypothetical protein